VQPIFLEQVLATMKIDPGQRAYQLVEELRAEVDFEIDDVIAGIVRNLPEEYFLTLTPADQIKHLKALLAISICQLNDWLTLKSDNGRQIAVLARQNFPGLLARIISSLPCDRVLVGAKIFTSTAHDFIIDLFEFAAEGEGSRENPANRLDLEDLIGDVVARTGASTEEVSWFLQHYPQQAEWVRTAGEIQEHFRAYREVVQHDADGVYWRQLDSQARFVIASPRLTARDLFQFAALVLSGMPADVERAFLCDFPQPDRPGHVAVASFLVAGHFPATAREYQNRLSELLRSS
jgi:hypothetical protein